MATLGKELSLSKCGIRFNPPAIILTYTKDGKTRRRTMPIRNFNKNSSVQRITDDLRSNSRHRSYLESLPSAQLEKLVAMIHDKLNGTPKEEIIANAKKIESIDPEEDLNESIDPEEDLNKVDDLTLNKKKAVMEQTFEKNRKRPDDPDFKYEVDVEFDNGPLETCGWDSDDKESDNEF